MIKNPPIGTNVVVILQENFSHQREFISEKIYIFCLDVLRLKEKKLK